MKNKNATIKFYNDTIEKAKAKIKMLQDQNDMISKAMSESVDGTLHCATMFNPVKDIEINHYQINQLNALIANCQAEIDCINSDQIERTR